MCVLDRVGQRLTADVEQRGLRLLVAGRVIGDDHDDGDGTRRGQRIEGLPQATIPKIRRRGSRDQIGDLPARRLQFLDDDLEGCGRLGPADRRPHRLYKMAAGTAASSVQASGRRPRRTSRATRRLP